ncbi:MAG: ATP synthase subunit I [Desulfobacteraceae bacterium]|nr:ATP synthase subunit I [Desulfobacteraceae bacterium]
MIDATRKIQKKYGSQAIFIAIVAAIAAILAGARPIGKGLLLGTIFSVVNFVVMAESLPLRMRQNGKKSVFFSFGGICMRYVLISIPLVLALKSEKFNFYATVAGIFMIQAVILINRLMELMHVKRSNIRPTG